MDADGAQLIPGQDIPAGQYTVSVSWESGGVGYYSQQAFIVH
jgi:hypothetical protein